MVVVGDIDRGGVFAALYGTWALLDEADRALISGFVINKFRGDEAVLDPGLAELTRRTGRARGRRPALAARPVAGRRGHPGGRRLAAPAAAAPATLRVAVVRLPRVSNVTDVDALAAEPGVEVRVTTDPDVVADADLAVLPGTRATVERPRLAAPHRAGRGAGRPGPAGSAGARASAAATRCWRARITDDVESGTGRRRRPGPAAGPGHLPGREGARPAGGRVARPPGVGVRDPPRGGRGRRRASRSWTAAGSARCGARCGTARWRTTGSAGPG